MRAPIYISSTPDGSVEERVSRRRASLRSVSRTTCVIKAKAYSNITDASQLSQVDGIPSRAFHFVRRNVQLSKEEVTKYTALVAKMFGTRRHFKDTVDCGKILVTW